MSDDKNHMTPDRDDYQRYLKGESSSSERHKIEHSALHDDFESEALEGYDQLEGREASDDIDQMVRLLPKKKPLLNAYQIAAVLAILAVATVSIIIISRPGIEEGVLAKKETTEVSEKSVDTTLIAENLPVAEPAEALEDPEEEPIVEEAPLQEAELTLDPQDESAIASQEVVQDSSSLVIVDEPTLTETTDDMQLVDTTQLIAAADDIEGSSNDVSGLALEEDRSELDQESQSVAARSVQASEPLAAEPTEQEVSEDRILSGTVTDQDGFPLPGVDVLLNGGSFSTITNSEGAFEFTVPNLSSMRIIFSSEDFRPLELPVTQDDIRVSLTKSQLSSLEIVTVGAGPENQFYSSGLEEATPSSGMVAFVGHIELSKGNFGPGLISLLVSLSADGQIINMEVERSLNQEADTNALSAVESWEAGWNAASYQGNPIECTLRIKIRY